METANVFKRNFTTWAHWYLDSQTLFSIQTFVCEETEDEKAHWMKKRTEQTRESSRVSRIFNQMFPKKAENYFIAKIASWCVGRLFIDEESWAESEFRVQSTEAWGRKIRTTRDRVKTESTEGWVGDGGIFLSVFHQMNERKMKSFRLGTRTKENKRTFFYWNWKQLMMMLLMISKNEAKVLWFGVDGFNLK